MLGNVALYWFSNSAGSAARQYYEDAKVTDHSAPAPVNPAPTGVSVFANDFRTIRAFADRENSNIVYWSEHDEGGHFAAMEVPLALSEDLIDFFSTLR